MAQGGSLAHEPSRSGDICKAYVDHVVSPQSFDSVATQFAKISPKTEFETSAQYDARRDTILRNTPSTVIIEKPVEDPSRFAYNADTQKMEIPRNAFGKYSFLYTPKIFAIAKIGEPYEATMGGLEVSISEIDKPTGSYQASNGFGAKGVISTVTRTVQAIHERLPERGEIIRDVFSRTSDADGPLDVLSLAPGAAQALRPKLRTAFVVKPRDPFVVMGSTPVGKVTLSNGKDFTMDFKMLFADIQCALLLDGSGRVLGAYPTL